MKSIKCSRLLLSILSLVGVSETGSPTASNIFAMLLCFIVSPGGHGKYKLKKKINKIILVY